MLAVISYEELSIGGGQNLYICSEFCWYLKIGGCIAISDFGFRIGDCEDASGGWRMCAGMECKRVARGGALLGEPAVAHVREDASG